MLSGGTAIAELWAFAYYGGHNEPDTIPPYIDPRKLSEYIRSVLEEMNGLMNERADILRRELDAKRLQETLAAYEKELLRLRTLVAEQAEPPPWNEYSAEEGIAR